MVIADRFSIFVQIFLAFVKPGLFTFGGGPSAIPLIREEVVERYGWLTIQEFTDALALGNSLPGPIATKMAALVGYKAGGWLGALIGIIAIVVPTALAIILLIKIYLNYKDADWLKGMMRGVRPVVVVLIAQVVYSMGRNSYPNYKTIIISLFAAAGIFIFNIHPVILIVGSMIFGGVFL